LASLKSLFGNRRWLAGYLTGWVGWALYIAAVAFAPLSLVQATSAGGVALLALIAWRWGSVALSLAVVLAVAGIGALAATLVAPRAAHGFGARTSRADPAWVVATIVAALIAARSPTWRGTGSSGI
jgi:hypothetical protein